MENKLLPNNNNRLKFLLTVVILAAVIIIAGIYLATKENKSADSDYYNMLEQYCAGDSCCLSSLKIMKENNYKEADGDGKCPEGFNMDMLKCKASYQWCAPIKAKEEIVNFKFQEYQTFSYDGGSMALDCYFIKGQVMNGQFQGRELLALYPNYTILISKRPKKDEIVKIFLTESKTILRNKYFEVYQRDFPEYCLKEKDIGGTKKNDYAFQEVFAFKMPVNKEESSISGWQTYRNEEYGFELKYPEDFTKQEIVSDNNFLYLKKSEAESDIFINLYLRKNYQIKNKITSELEAKEIKIGGRLGYNYFYQEGVGYSGVALVQLGQDALEITYDLIGYNKDNKISKEAFVENNLDQMLSTFKFVE